jgi:hypothetical protein
LPAFHQDVADQFAKAGCGDGRGRERGVAESLVVAFDDEPSVGVVLSTSLLRSEPFTNHFI